MPLEKFCPKCGKHVEEIIEGLCYQCYSLQKDLVEAPSAISIGLCKNCTRSREKNEWTQHRTFTDMLQSAVLNSVKADKDIAVKLTFDKKYVGGKTTIPVKIEAVKKSKDAKIKQESTMLVTINPQTCDNCGKQSGNYYEGIIQLRGNEQKCEEARNFIYSIVEKRVNKEANVFIAKELKLKEGIDLYIGSIKLSEKVLVEVKKKFDAETNKTYKLIGEKDGKTLKRVTILLRLK